MKDYNIWSSSLFVMAFVVLFIGGCKKEDVNLAPGKVMLSAPANAASEVAIDALLTWLATADPDGDVVTYDVYLDTESNPAKVISNDQRGTSLAVTLTGNTTYYWKVIANDGNGNMSQSAIWSFTTINQGPVEVILTAPEDASSNVALEAGLSWQAATDPDGDPVTYDVYFGTDATPATVVSAGQTDITFDPTLAGNTTYYWKVVANDGSGGTSESEVWSFTTLNNPPGEVILEAPANTSTDVMAATLSWQAATDPDGDPVTYDVYFGTDATPATVVSAGQTGTTFTPTSYANITYYWKIVAKDDKGGTSESEVWSFTTDIVQWSDTKRGTFYDSRDRKVYDVIKIGTQIWFAENLAYGAPGKQITNAITWQNNIAYDGWCYYNNDSRYAFSYGMLYQWELANDVCPAGWHLPSDAEWTTLIDNQRGASVAGGYLKEAGTTHWLAPNTGANNSSRFTALPGGLRDPSGNFVNARSTGYWWSSSEATNPLTIRSRIMYSNSTQVNTTKANKNSGLSVRCIRD